jgi:hypothetical protein
MDITPFVSHDPFVFGEPELAAFLNKTVAMTADIQNPPPVMNAEIKQRSKMGDKRLKEAEAELEIFKSFNSFLTPELSVLLMDKMLTCYKQSDAIEGNMEKLINKMWLHGDLAGIEVLMMLSLAERLARLHAKLGNADAITAINALDNLKRNRGGATTKSSGDETAKKKKVPIPTTLA